MIMIINYHHCYHYHDQSVWHTSFTLIMMIYLIKINHDFEGGDDDDGDDDDDYDDDDLVTEG